MFYLGPDVTLIWKKNHRCSHSISTIANGNGKTKPKILFFRVHSSKFMHMDIGVTCAPDFETIQTISWLKWDTFEKRKNERTPFIANNIWTGEQMVAADRCRNLFHPFLHNRAIYMSKYLPGKIEKKCHVPCWMWITHNLQIRDNFDNIVSKYCHK